MNQFIRYPCQSLQHMKFINRSLSSNKRLPVWFYVVGWSSHVHVSEILAYCKIWNGINIPEISSCQQLIHTQNIFWRINYRGICTLSDWSKFPQNLRVKKYYVPLIFPQKNLQQKNNSSQSSQLASISSYVHQNFAECSFIFTERDHYVTQTQTDQTVALIIKGNHFKSLYK